MYSSVKKFALVAPLILNVFAQTPNDFKPGTLVKLGVTYPSINIDPVGSAVQGLDQVQSEPSITVPTSNLLGPDGQVVPGQRYMVMMIDTDVIRNNVATTVLHWFQPDLVIDAAPPRPLQNDANGTAPPAVEIGMMRLIKLADQQKSITGVDLPANPIGQTNYLPPGPPPGPPHRYVQVLFAQPANFSVPACFKNVISEPGNPQANAQNRLGFDINQFLDATRTRTRPIAGNYFRAENAQPGSLTQGAVATQLVNAQCPGVTPGARTVARRWFS